MAVNNNKPVFLFEQNLKEWLIYVRYPNKFVSINIIPPLTENFAGIGTRQITDAGKKAIKEILEFNLNGKKEKTN